MAHENYIVAIDLGTSHLVGMVGKKNAQGKLTILAEEVEGSASCIRRGCVYNVEDTALRISRLVQKLQNRISGKLPGFTIEKVYIGVGGQSLRSFKHVEVKIINTDAVVSEDDINLLNEQCRTYKPDMLDVLGISAPIYYVDGKLTDNPVGIPCKRVEAHYRLIVGKPAIRGNIISSLKRTKIQLAGIIVSPLALADTVFSWKEKELGCALIDFGAGVTSVVVYKQKALIHLAVIPLGGNVITKDLTSSCRLVESEAEHLKITYGSAIMEKNKENSEPLEAKHGIKLRELNTVIEGRIKEIVANAHAQIKSTGEMDAVEKIVLAGSASALKNLEELVQDQFKKEVGYSIIREEWMADNDDRIGNPRYMTAISLLIKGTENCISYPIIENLNENEDEGNGDTTIEPSPTPSPVNDPDGGDSDGDDFFTKLMKKILK